MNWLIVGETHGQSELCCWCPQLLSRKTMTMHYMVDLDGHLREECLDYFLPNQSPPGRTRAYSTRSGNQAKAMEACRHLQAQRPVNRTELEKHATRAEEFTPTTVARVAKVLRHSLRAGCITAPLEADSQLKVMEGLYSGSGRRCFVRANDSGLTVLGVRFVIWDVNMEDGGLFGQCIRLASVLQLRGGDFSNSSI